MKISVFLGFHTNYTSSIKATFPDHFAIIVKIQLLILFLWDFELKQNKKVVKTADFYTYERNSSVSDVFMLPL